MHIGFDISQTGTGKAGCGFFAHAMIEAMLQLQPQHRYSLYPSFGDFYFDATMPLLSPYKGSDVHYGPRHLTREAAREFWTAADADVAAGSPDIVQSNNFWCPVQFESSRLIYTCYDLAFAVNPSWTTEANRRGCFDGTFRSAVAADWVVAISESSKHDYLQTYPSFPEERVRVIYPCSRFADDREEGRPPAAVRDIGTGTFWLSVGTIEPRKNQRRLVRAYADYLARGGKPMPLVLAGGKGWLMEDFRQELEELGIEKHVIMTGYVTDAELVWLYRHCYVNLYPSLFEGFGLPVLEGMQFGAATVTSMTTSLPEVAGDAAICLDPHDIAAWTGTLLRLASDASERARLSDAARARAKTFKWDESASSLMALYEEALATPKRRPRL